MNRWRSIVHEKAHEMTDGQLDILQEQIAYYHARAQEYDESINLTGRFAHLAHDEGVDQAFAEVAAALLTLPPVERTLELACGTGMWTQALVKISQSVTAVDASSEMIEINRQKIADPRVQYQQADLFRWQPDDEYDLVMFGFWISHVPPDMLDNFLAKVKRALRVGGRVFIVDEPLGVVDDLTPLTEGNIQPRTLADGRTFKIVKVFYDPVVLKNDLSALGFDEVNYVNGEHFFHLSGKRAR
jgi:demethylmenaquinone methyltransferase/2-methoxy-6-polyprenyl-1,4-benzoquinol methylase